MIQNSFAKFCFEIPRISTPFFNENNMLKMEARSIHSLPSLLFGGINSIILNIYLTKLTGDIIEQKKTACGRILSRYLHRIIHFRILIRKGLSIRDTGSFMTN